MAKLKSQPKDIGPFQIAYLYNCLHFPDETIHSQLVKHDLTAISLNNKYAVIKIT